MSWRSRATPVDESPSEGWRSRAQSVEAEASNPGTAAVRQFVQGTTGNFSDEAAGGMEAAGRAIGLKGVGGPMRDISIADGGPTLDWEVLKDAYRRARDQEREALKKEAKEHPKTAALANLAGAIASPINKIMPGASLAKSGAVIGGVSGAGASEAEDAQGLLIDTATGTVIGGVAGKAAQKIAPVIEKGARAAREKVGEKAKSAADWLSARALGAERGTIKSLGADKVKAIGRYALDEGVITARGSTDQKIARNLAKQQAGADKMNAVYDAIDEKGLSTFNPLDAAVEVDSKIGGFYRSPINRGETNQLENTLESILMRGDKNIPLKEAQSLKEELGKVANWKNKLNITDKEKMARDAYGVVSSRIDEAVDKGAKEIGSNDLLETLKEGRRLYSLSKGAEQLLENKLAREQGNNIIGLTDAITGGGALTYGAVSGDYEGAIGIVAAKKVLSRYGAQNAALGFDRVSKMLLREPKFAAIAKSNPATFKAIVSNLTRKVTPTGALPKAADRHELDRDSSTPAIEKVSGRDNYRAPTKGPAKWANDGFEKLSRHGLEGLDRAALMSDRRTKDLLIRASDLKPGSKAMDRIAEKLKARTAKGGE